MIRKALVVGVYCFVTGNAWVCVAHDRDQRCKLEYETRGCSVEQIDAFRDDLCGSNERSVTTTSTTTSTTLGIGSAIDAFPTVCPTTELTSLQCRHYDKRGVRAYRCVGFIGSYKVRCVGLGKVDLYGCKIRIR